MSNFNNQLRREQLITPFGVGAMTVLPDGMSIIMAGIDHWFGNDGGVLKSECEIDDWRLSGRLGVKHLYSPPTVKSNDGQMFVRGRLPDPKVPVLRFPTWYFCKYCSRMENKELDFFGPLRCPNPSHLEKGMRPPVMFQVPYVVMCKSGHLDDFPWREWAHRSANFSCMGVLRFAPSGNSNPQGTRVYCDSCKASRNLEFITSERNGRTYLSTALEKGEEFLCSGRRPWLGDSSDAKESCANDIRGSFRGSSNLYFSLVETSLYVPQSSSNVPEELLELLSRTYMNACKILANGDSVMATSMARQIDLQNNGGLKSYTDEEVIAAYDDIFGLNSSIEFARDQSRESYLRMEYELFQSTFENDRLRIHESTNPYSETVSRYFDSIKLVPTLVETSALWGFTRYESNPSLSFEDGRKMLALNPSPSFAPDSWLPAKQTKGEGIYLQFSDALLRKWESRQSVISRVSKFTNTEFSDSFRSVQLSPRYAMIHTFSHLLIKQLVFYCGYSQASLKERLYVSDGGQSMSGLLIYTASGDSEGTLGGLVRMGKPGFLEQIIEQALREAEWCSNDPVCSESGEVQEDGDVINRLSACYACGLIPETACESFNLFLDRSLIVGDLLAQDLAFFQISR
jgi:hypothetical protein